MLVLRQLRLSSDDESLSPNVELILIFHEVFQIMLPRFILLYCCFVLLYCISCEDIVNAAKSGLIQSSPFAANNAIKAEQVDRSKVTPFLFQKRDFRAYPQWFSQRIKKLVGKRFMHFYPQDQRKINRNNLQSQNYRRSFYGLPGQQNGFGLPGQQNGFGPYITQDDVGLNSITPQSLRGAELVDLPNNVQALQPHDFHQFALHADLNNHGELPEDQLIALPDAGGFLLGNHHHHHHNPCHRRPCLNGGSCVHHKHIRGFRCMCHSGFRGHYCEIPSVSCIPNPCKNDGSCTLHDHGFFCSCPADYKGPSCSVQTSCFSNPCMNGGTCVELDNSFSCQCVGGYEGQICLEKLDVCKSNPCKNDGVCKEFGTTFECICREGFSCADCSCNTTTIIRQTTKQTSCPASACKNGASCFATDKGYNCQCLDGYHGVDCSIPDLCKKNPCENGGVCVQVGIDYKCICTYGFKGTNCHLPLSCSSHPCINGGTCREADIDFKCVCPLGYKGDSCEELNPCAHSPCAHSAHCIEKGPFYTCICEEGYRGKDCRERDPCHPNPCVNGACYELTVGVAHCNCSGGWAGDLCELRNECFPNRCLNGGTCTHNGQSYHCICTDKFHGASCELANPCSQNPCRNSGVCTVTETGYVCSCVDGFKGKTCDIGGHCHPNPCLHGGKCFEGDNEFICECLSGFTGQLCEVQDFCDHNPCHNNGQCIEEVGTYSCTCPFGFLGEHCEQSICLPSPCRNGGTCIASNTEHGYACECVFPYHGHDCEEWDPCIPSPCKNGGTCKSHLKEINELHLHEGALQNMIHGADESVVDVVEPDDDSLGDYNFTTAHHPELYEEHDQATNSELEHIHRAHYDKEIPHFDSEHSDWPQKAHSEYADWPTDALHHHNHHLTNDDHDLHPLHTETLPETFQTVLHGQSADLDDHSDIGYEEANSIHAAHAHATENPHEGEHPYTSHYPHDDHMITQHDDDDDDRISNLNHEHHGHHHIGATTFKDHSGGIHEELLTLTDHSNEREPISDKKAQGVNKLDKETLEEITKNVVKAVLKNKEGGGLSKKNEIAKMSKSSKNEIRKRTLQNLYVCECPPGYLGAHCQHSNPCEKSPCLNGGVCLPRGNRYQCQCMSGFAGERCEDLHPCDPNPCQNGGSCRLAHNTRGYHCDCPLKYRGYQCEKINHCANGNPCQHGGKCHNTNIGIECRCRQRYGGNLCEIDKCEGCSLNAHCKQGHCVCKPGFIGNGYKCKAIGDICSPNPCENNGKCLPGQDGKLFICQCKSGFTGNRCEFFNPCQSTPCLHNGVCVDNSNSRQKGIILIEHTDYKCFCPQGYRGKNCEETSLAACSSVPCLNNATCFDSSDENHRKNLMHPDDYECFCRQGYSGKQCEIPHYACWSHPCQNGGSCLDPSVLPEVSFDSHGYKCNCLPSYIGRNCEVTVRGASPCYSAPCLHNGRCVDVTSNTDSDLHFEDFNSYKCFCDASYSGKNCEVPFPACTSAPCYHNGTCIDRITHPDFNFDEHGYHCLCSVGYEGKNCERQYVFTSPEEEEQILHPTDTPDFELLTPTPLVVYMRPPKTTPPTGTLKKPKPGIIVVKHRTTPKPPLDLPIEDISLKQAHDASHHADVIDAVNKDQVANQGSSNQITKNKEAVKGSAESNDKGQSTLVHIIPDTGTPGGAASIVDQVPKDGSNNAAGSKMVSLIPDAPQASKPVSQPSSGRQSVPSQAETQTMRNSYWQQNYAGPQIPLLSPYANQVQAAVRSNNNGMYNYYGYQSPSNVQTGQARSLNSAATRSNWLDAYNRLLQQRLSYQRKFKKNKIPFYGRP